MRLNVEGNVPPRGIIVCNHLSYLDILAFGSLLDGVFVSKREVARWPLIGMFTRLSGTIFVDRTQRAKSSVTVAEMCVALRDDVSTMFFPEGTSSDGTAILRFRAALFQAALETEEPVFPSSIEYNVAGGKTHVAERICYFGDMTFFPHLLRFLCLRDVSATIRFGRPILHAADRFDLALQAQREVSRLAGVPTAPELPPTPMVQEIAAESGQHVVNSHARIH